MSRTHATLKANGRLWFVVSDDQTILFRPNKRSAVRDGVEWLEKQGGGTLSIYTGAGKLDRIEEVGQKVVREGAGHSASYEAGGRKLSETDRLRQTVRTQRGMLKKQAGEIKRLEKHRVALSEVKEKEGRTRSHYQVRMRAALHALHEIAGRTPTSDGGWWPENWGVVRAQSAIKEDAIQEALDNGWVTGERRLPTWLRHRLKVRREKAQREGAGE